MKLWLMLSALAALSLLGADYLPLFQEFRVLAMLLIVFSSDKAQVRLYDTVFAPTLVRISEFWHSPQRKAIMTRTLALLVVKSCIFCAIATMNALRSSRSSGSNSTNTTNNHNHCSAKGDVSESNDEIYEYNAPLTPDMIEDVISGLLFSQRALSNKTETKDKKFMEAEKEQQVEDISVKIKKVLSTEHYAKSKVAAVQPHSDVKLPTVVCDSTSAPEHNKVEQAAVPLKVSKPPLFQGRLEQWLSAHANVPPLRPGYDRTNNRNNVYAASHGMYANYESAATEHKQYAQSERYCVNSRGVDNDVASTTSYSPGAWGAEWYYADKTETLSATEEGAVRHRKRRHHKHTRPRTRSSDRQ